MITLTDAAVSAIRQMAEKRGTPSAALRLGVKGGGCTGFAYLFEWCDGPPKEHDSVFEKDGVRLYVDPKSLVYLDGTEVGYVKTLMKSGFDLKNPNVKSSCGCGDSVQF
jgi:iron-sulfur cluster assembly protein